MPLYNSKTSVSWAVRMPNNQEFAINPFIHFAADEILKKPNYVFVFILSWAVIHPLYAQLGSYYSPGRDTSGMSRPVPPTNIRD